MQDTPTNDETGPTAGFARLERLKKRREFVAAAKGARAHKPNLSLQRLRREASDHSDDSLIRVGFTVTKKEGNSVERNRIRRRLREAARQVVPENGDAGTDYVLIGRRAALASPFPSLLKDLKEALAEAAKRAARGARPAPRPTSPSPVDKAGS